MVLGLDRLLSEFPAIEMAHPHAHLVRGIAYLHRGELENAVHDLARASHDMRELGNTLFEHYSNVFRARALLNAGDLDQAKTTARDVLEAAREAGAQLAVVWALQVLGRVALSRGDLDQARTRLEEALRISQQGQLDMLTADTLDRLGELEQALGNPERAVQLLAAGEHLRQAVGLARPLTEGQAHQNLLNALRRHLGPETFHKQWEQAANTQLEDLPGEGSQAPIDRDSS